MGIDFGKPKIDLDQLRQWKNQVIEKLASGLMTLNNKRSIQLMKAKARFEKANEVHLEGEE